MKTKKWFCFSLILMLFVLFSAMASANSLGDVDGDGTITSSDARLALRAAVGLDSLTEVQNDSADIDNDKNITSSDARLILRISVGLDELQLVCGHEYNQTVIQKSCATDSSITYTCSKCGDYYAEQISDIYLSIRHSGTSSATINGYGNFSKTYTISVSGGYGSLQLKYELFSSATATTPIDTIDYTSNTSYSVSYRGYENTIDNYIVQITVKDKANNQKMFRINLGNTNIITQEILPITHKESDLLYNIIDCLTIREYTKCLICDKILYDDTIPGVGHQWKLISDTTESNHYGFGTYKCTVCDEEKLLGNDQYTEIIFAELILSNDQTEILACSNLDTANCLVLPDTVTNLDTINMFLTSTLKYIVLQNRNMDMHLGMHIERLFVPQNATSSLGIYNNGTLSYLIIEDDATCIPYLSVYDVENFVIPKSVTQINDKIMSTANIKNVYYNGTPEEWNNLIENSSGISALVLAEKYFYSEIAPIEEGNYWHYVDGLPVIWQ